jgi:hypothetical protein
MPTVSGSVTLAGDKSKITPGWYTGMAYRLADDDDE